MTVLIVLLHLVILAVQKAKFALFTLFFITAGSVLWQSLNYLYPLMMVLVNFLHGLVGLSDVCCSAAKPICIRSGELCLSVALLIIL